MNRSLALVAALLVCCGPLFATPICGDANDDTQVNILDALDISRFAAGLGALTASQQLQADVNDDGGVDVIDGLLTAQYSAGLVVSLTCPPFATSGTWGRAPVQAGPTKLYALDSWLGTVTVIDIAAGTTLGSVSPGSGVGLAADPLRDIVYVSSGGDEVHVIDTTTDTLASSFFVSGLMGAIEVSPDGSALVGISTSGLVVVDLPARTLRHSIWTGGAGFGSGYLAISPDSLSAWRSDDFADSVTRVDLVTGTSTATVPVGMGPYGIDVSANGDMVFVINHYEETLSRIDTATNLEVLPRQPLGVYPMAVLGHSNGSAFAVNCISANVSEHDAATGQQTGVFGTGAEPIDIAEIDAGTVAVVNSGSSWISVIDPVAGTQRNISLSSPPWDITAK